MPWSSTSIPVTTCPPSVHHSLSCEENNSNHTPSNVHKSSTTFNIAAIMLSPCKPYIYTFHQVHAVEIYTPIIAKISKTCHINIITTFSMPGQRSRQQVVFTKMSPWPIAAHENTVETAMLSDNGSQELSG